MITVTAITLELSQTLPSGEEQRLIVEYDGEKMIISSEAWTDESTPIVAVYETADSCLAHAKLRIAAIEEGLI